MKRTFSAFLILAIVFLAHAPTLLAATKSSRVVFKESVSTTDLQQKYDDALTSGDKVRILIVPGHEADFGGTQYNGYYERELVVPIAEKLARELRNDPRLEVLVARGSEGWNRDFSRYFDRNMKSIKKFVDTHKKEMQKLVKRGKVDVNEEQASHNAAPNDVALRLYGITKWSNENDVDLMLHIHLNDTGGRADTMPGNVSGFTVYVPDDQYGNAKASRAIAEPIFASLNAHNATSTLQVEDKGIVEDQELIALGSNNTSEVPSILIEYGYIYEPKFANDAVRSVVFDDMAYQTSQGIADFFGTASSARYVTKALPYTFLTDVAATSTAATGPSVGTYALQTALHDLGFYPLAPSTLVNCPIDGVMRSCVTDAVTAFQKSRGIDAVGTLGVATRNALNATFSSVPVTQVAEAPAVPAASLAIAPVPAAACTPFTATTLALNSTDAVTSGEVTKLQRTLAKDPSVYPQGSVTGFYGPATDKAIKAFQIKNGLATATSGGYGLVGPATRATLVNVCAL